MTKSRKSNRKSLNIIPLSPSHDQAIIDFLNCLGQSNPSVLGYHYPLYRDMLDRVGLGKSLYLGAWENSRLVGLLPGFLKKTRTGLVYSSLPYFGPNAGVICDDNDLAADVHEKLLLYVMTYLRAQPAVLSASFTTPFLFSRFEYYDRVLSQALVIPKFTQYLYLPDAKWDSSILYDLRKTSQCGLSITSEVTLDRLNVLYQIYRQNCADYGIPLKPYSAISDLVCVGITEKKVSCYFAYQSDIMVGGLIIIWGPLTASYYIPCTLASARKYQPGTLLINRAVNDARARGISYWNWEASPSRESGVYKFKQKWGSRKTDYRIYVVPFREPDFFRSMGRESLMEEFPYFFVYPHDKL